MRAPDDSHGPPPTLSDLLRLTRNLEQAWRQVAANQPAPDLRTYLPPPSDPLRPAAIRELVSADLEIRWRRKLPITLEDYIQNYPELGGTAALSAELIYKEYRLRHQFGDKPSLTVYRERFPTQYRRLLELTQAERGSSPAAVGQGAASPVKKASAPRSAPPPPAGSGKRERPPARESSAEHKRQASAAAADPSAAPEANSLPVLPYVPPLPPPAKDESASSNVETSGREEGTFAPTPASGKRTGDILFPSDDEALEGTDPVMVPMVGGYNLLKRLGSGALGEVWKAEAPGGVEVAIKRLSRTLEAQEAQYERQSLEHVKRLRHRYLAQIHAYWVNKGRLFVVMELADGSLLDRVDSCRRQGLAGVPCDELLRHMREAAEAIDFLHAEGVHHRDIKPANILLLNGHVKLADFGLARPLQEGESVINATFCGTPAYMAPELWESKFSTHSDQWSLAITYLELRLNRRPFKGRDVPSLMTEIRQGRIDLSPLPKAERRVLRRALRQDPHQRYPNCTAFAEALEAAFRPPPPPPPRPRWLRTTVALLACLVAGGLLASLVRTIIPPDPPRVYLPPGYEADGEQIETDASGTRYYKHIRRPLDEREKVEFVLVPRNKKEHLQRGEPDVESFYISRCKITRGQFRWFAAQETTDEGWKKFANDHEDMPVRGVMVRDAYTFADRLGGRLPSLDQWDKAAGLWHPSRGQDPYWEGPYRGKWSNNKGCAVAIGRLEHPLGVDDDGEKDDVSVYGCRGMAGNGREWTRATRGREASFEEIRQGLPRLPDMILRGWNFKVQEDPLTFAELENQRKLEDHLLLKEVTETGPDISFRVVLEPSR